MLGSAQELLMKASGVVLASAAVMGLSAGLLAWGPTPAEPEGTKPATAAVDSRLAALSFLAGTWVSDHKGQYNEETWSKPHGDGIIGYFRWQQPGGTTTLYELLSIKLEATGPTLRLRHFDKAFEPWKSEANGVPAMAATETAEGRVVFTNASAEGGIASIEYHSPKREQLLVTVKFKDEKRGALKFDFARSN